MSFESQYATYY